MIMIITTVDYDFSLLPTMHHRRDFYVIATYVLVLVGSFGLTVYGGQMLVLVAQIALVLATLSLGAYLFLVAHAEKVAFARFISTYATYTCTYEDMLAIIPPCFLWLKDKADVVSINVSDGYGFELAQGVNCVVFVFEYTLKEGRFTRTYQFSIAQIHQSRVFPHLFLEGKQVGGLYPYDDRQELHLEGDFDDYFNLYVPGGEQVDALTILTPDVMQVLVDGGRPYDLELVDDMLVVIAAGNPYMRAKLPVLFTFLSAVTAKLSNSVSAEFDQIDLTAALDSELKPRRVAEVPFFMLVVVAVALFAAIWSSSGRL